MRLATSYDSIRFYFAKSLLSFTHEATLVDENLSAGLKEMEQLGLVETDEYSNYAPTKLGKAIVASAIDPDDGVFVHAEMLKTLRAFVMDGDMHILYVFTPVQSFGVNINWQIFQREITSLDESGIRVLRFLGLKLATIEKLSVTSIPSSRHISLLTQLSSGQGASLQEETVEEQAMARIYRRFYLALQLRDLCNEIPVHIVARKYDTPRGVVQSLAQTCQGFAAGMVKFCENMGWE